jgi:hypothetical protein
MQTQHSCYPDSDTILEKRRRPLSHLGMCLEGRGVRAWNVHCVLRSSTGLMNLVNYKKEYLNLFSSNNHQQTYRPRG